MADVTQRSTQGSRSGAVPQKGVVVHLKMFEEACRKDQETTKRDCLASPAVMTLVGHEATIRIGQDVTVGRRNQEGRDIEAMEFCGLLAKILAEEANGGKIKLRLYVDHSEIIPRANAGTQPEKAGVANRLKRTVAETSVVVQSGETVVLGGLVVKTTPQSANAVLGVQDSADSEPKRRRTVLAVTADWVVPKK
jgi:Flp pilus assembly secretin CpaC